MKRRTNHRRSYTYTCPVCQGTFHPRRIPQIACSIKCAARWKSSNEVYRTAGLIGGRIGGATRRKRVLERWREMWPGVPPEAVREIYRRGYGSGYMLGEQRGYRRGFAEALGEDTRDVA